LASSISIYDIFIWGAVILLLQLVTFFIIDFLVKDLSDRITKGELAPTILLSTVKLSVAAINAAAIAG